MLEHCDRCLTTAPPWESSEYLDWHLGADADGVYLGVICPSCFACEGLAFIWADPSAAERHSGERLTIVASSGHERAGRTTSSTSPQMRTAA